jgi:hypothetical protein
MAMIISRLGEKCRVNTLVLTLFFSDERRRKFGLCRIRETKRARRMDTAEEVKDNHTVQWAVGNRRGMA